jgi:hypothetical protein
MEDEHDDREMEEELLWNRFDEFKNGLSASSEDNVIVAIWFKRSGRSKMDFLGRVGTLKIAALPADRAVKDPQRFTSSFRHDRTPLK